MKVRKRRKRRKKKTLPQKLKQTLSLNMMGQLQHSMMFLQF
jgi:hypothetical protein